MKRSVRIMLCMIIGIGLSTSIHAQGMAGTMKGMHSVLDRLYEEMLPLCSQLIAVGRGIGGFAATWFIAVRVWGHLSRAEPVEVYPLFRPFVIGFAILMFPSVIGLINGVMKPTVTATASMVEGAEKAIEVLLKQKEEAIKGTAQWQMYVGMDGSGDRDRWYQYTHPDDPTGSSEGFFESIGNDIRFAMAKASYSFRNTVKQWMSEVLEIIFQAAALCINTIRTFYMVVLAILGPLVFGISVFDGFQHTLTVWIARYLNVFLWLPVANIFGSIIGKIQEQMLKLDLEQISDTGDTFFSSTDTAYLIFMIIGIIGYFTVPSVANYIVHAGGSNALLQKVTSVFSSSTAASYQSVSNSTSSMVRDVYGDAAGKLSGSINNAGGSNQYFKDKVGGKA